MFGKAATLTLLAIIGTVGGTFVDNETWTGFTARWPVLLFNGLYSVPQTYDDAIASDWTVVTGATNRSDVVALGYYGNARFIVFFNTTTGDATGVQHGFPVENNTNSTLPVDYYNFNGITPKTLNGDEYFTAAIWFRVNADGSRQLWIEYNWILEEIPTNATELVNTTPWLEKNCILTMGTHYYRINSTSTSNDFHPWSFLAHGGTIIGFLFQAIGSTTVDSTRKWNEDIPAVVIPLVISDAPSVLLENVANYGVISVHTWLYASPWSITC